MFSHVLTSAGEVSQVLEAQKVFATLSSELGVSRHAVFFAFGGGEGQELFISFVFAAIGGEEPVSLFFDSLFWEGDRPRKASRCSLLRVSKRKRERERE